MYSNNKNTGKILHPKMNCNLKCSFIYTQATRDDPENHIDYDISNMVFGIVTGCFSVDE